LAGSERRILNRNEKISLSFVHFNRPPQARTAEFRYFAFFPPIDFG
jgi:hypothetical protein